MTTFDNEKIILYNNNGLKKNSINALYSRISITLGRNKVQKLSESLIEEEKHLEELKKNSLKFAPYIIELNEIYSTYDIVSTKRFNLWNEYSSNLPKTQNINERTRILNTYFTIPYTIHAEYLDILTKHLFAGSEGDHSTNDISLVRFIIDFMCRMLRRILRKTKIPQAFHLIEVAMGIAKNGQDVITIIGGLLHDIIEEAVDESLDDLIKQKFPNFSTFDKIQKNNLRSEIIKENIDIYNNRAAGIFYAIGLYMYYYISKFPFPEKYYQAINTIMEIIARLSRTKDISYYEYLNQLFFPQRIKKDSIKYPVLLENVKYYYPNAENYLKDYIEKVDKFYQTPYGEFSDKFQLERNSFREILIKILDRLNNTRDMDSDHYTIAAQLYNAGFKNLYLIQSIQTKIDSSRKMRSEEKKIIEVKFLNKIIVASLYQMLKIGKILKQKIGEKKYNDIETYLNEFYKKTPNFTTVITDQTVLKNSERFKYNFDGVIDTFNKILLGNKNIILELDKDLVRLAKITLVFKSLFEAYLVLRPFSIKGLEKLINKPDSEQNAVQKFGIKTFQRKIIY